jgi:hypothetical protein
VAVIHKYHTIPDYKQSLKSYLWKQNNRPSTSQGLHSTIWFCLNSEQEKIRKMYIFRVNGEEKSSSTAGCNIFIYHVTSDASVSQIHFFILFPPPPLPKYKTALDEYKNILLAHCCSQIVTEKIFPSSLQNFCFMISNVSMLWLTINWVVSM